MLRALSLQLNTNRRQFIDLYLLSLSFVLFHHTLHFILSGLHVDGFSDASVRMGLRWGGLGFLFVYLPLLFHFRIRFSY